MSRWLIFVFSGGSYLASLITFVYAVGFIGNFGVPKTMDSAESGDRTMSLLVDLALLGLFAVQHSVMARPAFKRRLTRILPQAAERSLYVLASSAALMLLFWQWRPLGGAIWSVDSAWGRVVLYAGFATGWLLVFYTTFVINHFHLFGLLQAWWNLRRREQGRLGFVTPVVYRMVRHPLYVGWLMVFWSTPAMTATHLVFASIATAYILVAIRFEERDLMIEHPEYVEYRRQVPMLIPRPPSDIALAPRMDMAALRRRS